MKIKHIFSLTILLLVLFFDLQLAFADGGNTFPTPTANGVVKCPAGKILVVDDENKSTCEAGPSYCESVKMKYDPDSKACYATGQGTILPFTNLTVEECNKVFDDIASNPGSFKTLFEGGVQGTGEKDKVSGQNLSVNTLPVTGVGEVSVVDVLGCGIKTGKMKLWMIPYYIKYLLQFVLSIAGIVAVGAMVVGGYLYMFGTVMDDKEKGKRSVMYGIMGFVVVLLAWAIVNVVISLATM